MNSTTRFVIVNTRNCLADDLGAPKNPASATLAGGTAGGINAKVG